MRSLACFWLEVLLWEITSHFGLTTSLMSRLDTGCFWVIAGDQNVLGNGMQLVAVVIVDIYLFICNYFACFLIWSVRHWSDYFEIRNAHSQPWPFVLDQEHANFFYLTNDKCPLKKCCKMSLNLISLVGFANCCILFLFMLYTAFHHFQAHRCK